MDLHAKYTEASDKIYQAQMLQDKADDRAMRKKAHELKKRRMVMEQSTKRAQEHNDLMKKVAARQVVDTMNALTHS